MKDNKFKNVSSNNYKYIRENSINWCNKYCNNGTASLKGLRQCYGWTDACIILCDNVYMTVPKEIFETL